MLCRGDRGNRLGHLSVSRFDHAANFFTMVDFHEGRSRAGAGLIVARDVLRIF
jgi:hypothetical protein